MGIPSYYRLLCNKNPKTIQKTYTIKGKTILCLDFNCIVYYCLQKLGEYDENNNFTYEKLLINEVCKYVEYIWKKAGACDELFIAVDGVVPMAKMKQQRLRRFKSIVLESYEIQQKVRTKEKKVWDRNSITPGTIFMKKLHKDLQELCAKHKGWSVSGFDAPGEGEHKVMKYIRNSNAETCLVYGLDADLILLSMLNSFEKKIYLMREELEFNRVVKDNYNEEQFLYLDIDSSLLLYQDIVKTLLLKSINLP